MVDAFLPPLGVGGTLTCWQIEKPASFWLDAGSLWVPSAAQWHDSWPQIEKLWCLCIWVVFVYAEVLAFMVWFSCLKLG
jgi:hypothetical protein